MYQVQKQLPAKPTFREIVRLYFDPRRIDLAPSYRFNHSSEIRDLDAAYVKGDFNKARELLKGFAIDIMDGIGKPPVEMIRFLLGEHVANTHPLDPAVPFLREQYERFSRLKDIQHFHEIGSRTPVEVFLGRLGHPYLCINTGSGVDGLSEAVIIAAKEYLKDALNRNRYPIFESKGEIMVEGESVFRVHATPYAGLEQQVKVETPPENRLGQDRLASIAILYALGKRIAPVREFHPLWRSNASNKN